MIKRLLMLFSAAVALVSSSCTKEIRYNDYVELSLTSYTFGADEETPLVINISTNESAPWTVSAEDVEWLSYSQNGNQLLVQVTRNKDKEIRETVLTLLSGDARQELSLRQLPHRFSGRMMDFPITSGGGFSANGLYAGYVGSMFNAQTGKFDYSCRIYNTLTGEYRNYEVPELHRGVYYTGIKCISNDGRTILFDHSAGAKTCLIRDGKRIPFENPEGMIDGQPWYFNEDASILVGRAKTDDRDRMTFPVVWRNGTPEVLEIPEFIADGSPMPINGVILRGCSNDGRVIYGSEWKRYGLIYWKDGKMYDMGAKYAEILGEGRSRKVALIQTTSSNNNISANGKFIAATYNSNGGGAFGALNYPVVINTETAEATIYKEYPNLMGMSAMNDGTIFVGAQLGAGAAGAIDYRTGILKEISQWSQERYGIRISGDRYISYVTSDEQVIFGMKMIRSGVESFTPVWFLRR